MKPKSAVQPDPDSANPWEDEPDQLGWTSETGLACLILRNDLGCLCGYVGLGDDHPLHGNIRTWDDFENHNDWRHLQVHGGVTFCGFMADAFLPEPNQGQNLWWIGFDCSKNNDRAPKCPETANRPYRDLAFVKKQCERLAGQLAASPCSIAEPDREAEPA